MARIRRSRGFTALRAEGGILPPDFLQVIATLEAPQQAGVEYGLSKSLALKEELARYWCIANDLYARYFERRVRHDLIERQVSVDEWLLPLLRLILGYNDLTTADSTALGDQVFKLTHRACGEAVPFLLITHDFNLDKANPKFGYEGRRQSPHGLMQEYLNAENNSLWGIISNGSKLRVLRDNPSLTRPSYIEADLDLIFDEKLYPDFAALWLSIHASRLKPVDKKPSSCIIETWRTKAHETGERALEKLRDGVTETLRQIGNGFLQHPDNNALRIAFKDGTLSPKYYLQQLLGLVYRLLFLFAAEDRGLLHAPDSTDVQRIVFADGYSLSRLRERVLRRRYYDHHRDIWEGLQITFRALARGEPVLGLPALGGLFCAEQCPHLDNAAIANERLLEAIRTLSFFSSDKVLVRINYRDMGTEELGSVYESLLELQPTVRVNAKPWTFGFIGDESGENTRGSERKLTGSYYTPSVLVNELIKSVLEPVLSQAVADHPENPRAAILNLKILDPACGSGHFLLAAARRMAGEIVRIESGTDTSDEIARQHALREVVQHCIYGVDKNSLGVELCKTALWIETVEPGKPLTFLDSHIQLGNSLIGILEPEVMASGIPKEAYAPLTGDEKDICRSLKKLNSRAGTSVQGNLLDENSTREIAVTTADLDAMPESTVDDIARKSIRWKEARQDEPHIREKLRANLYVGAYFAVKTLGTRPTVAHTEDINRIKIGMLPRTGVEEAVGVLAGQHNFFHWHLAFAEIMRCGGFDVVLGNPPWERIKLQEQEFFASRSQEIASAPNKAARDRLIKHLDREDALPSEKALFDAFKTAKRDADAASQFVRTGGRCPLTGVGDVNTYAAFAETFLKLLNPRGRAGMIVPTGIATDDLTKAFFGEIVAKKRLVSLYDFENREKVFPSIHSAIKFCLLTLSGTGRPHLQAEFAFFLRQAGQIAENERLVSLSTEDFTLFNPNTRTCPIFRTRRDMEIARKMFCRAGVLWKEAKGKEPEVNPWGVKFSRMFDMSNDSNIFCTHEQLTEDGWHLEGNEFLRGEERYVPLYEAKLFYQYDHRFATFDGVSAEDRRKGNTQPITSERKADSRVVVVPRYWVHERELAERLDKLEISSYNRPSTLDPRPSTLDPRPSTLDPRPSTLDPRPSTLDPRPSTLDPRPSTLDPRDSRRIGSQLALRDITNATNERTGILAMIPPFGLGHTGTIIIVGSLPSGILPMQQISEHRSPRFYEESP